MNTPIYDFLLKYSNENFLRMHMPAHKGKVFENNLLSQIYTLDITEISGADSLFEADGIILESEKNASKLFGVNTTIYSTQGSTLCIQTMLALMKAENRSVIAVRNTHRAFLNACALLDMNVNWLYPEYQNTILSGNINLSQLESTLNNTSEKTCVYITSPDYLGKVYDIKSISEICHKYNTPLLVDNAHGACLAFIEPAKHPITLGADLCCDSAHKMLPALTGSAYLHIGNPIYSQKSKDTMSLFASTSPSYLILASLDLCNKYISENIKSDLKNIICLISDMKKRLAPSYSFYENGEPLHLTILANPLGLYGYQLAEILHENKIECEYADNEYVVLLFSPVNTADDIKHLEAVLRAVKMPRIFINPEPIYFPKPKKAMSIRNACFSPYEEIEVDKACGRICASLKVPCPPAVPIAISGEIISEECINIFKRYGIMRVNVVK